MKQFRIILILIFITIVVVFSVQNADTVEVKFFTMKVETSRSLLMLSCVVLGSVSTLLALIPSLVKAKKETTHDHTQDEDKEAD